MLRWFFRFIRTVVPPAAATITYLQKLLYGSPANDGSMVLDTASTGDYRDIQPGRCLTFDGSTQYVSIPEVTLSGEFTISYWAYHQNPSSGGGDNRPLGHSSEDTYIGLQSAAYVRFRTNGTSRNFILTKSLSDWNHFLIRRDSSNSISAWVNGVKHSDEFVHLSDLHLDQIARYSTTDYFRGSVMGVKVYSRTLTDDEITAIYRQGLQPDSIVAGQPDDLVGRWLLDDNSQTTAYDSSGNGNHGTIVGYATGMLYEGDDVPYSAQNLVGWSPLTGFVPDVPEVFGSGVSLRVDNTAKDDRMEIDESALENLNTGSISWWQKNPSGLIFSLGAQNTTDRLIVYVNGDDNSAFVRCEGKANNVTFKTDSSPSGFSRLQWNHYCITQDGVALKIYINGVLQGYDAGPNNIWMNDVIGLSTNANSFAIDYFGSLQTWGWGKGLTKDLRFYSDALTADEVEYVKTLGSSGTDPTTANLIHRYLFDGNFEDSAGSNDGTFYGQGNEIVPVDASDVTKDALNSPVQYTGTVPKYATLINAPCLDFDGSTQYVGTNVQSFGGDFTLTAWVKASTWAGPPNHIFYRDDGTFFGIMDATYFRLRIGYNSNDIYGLTIPLNQWNFLVVRRSGGVINGWCNGEKSASTRTDNGGFSFNRLNKVLNGSLFDLRAYDRALTDAEINDLPDDPVFWTPFSEGDGNKVYDVVNGDSYSITGYASTMWDITQSQFFYSFENGCNQNYNKLKMDSESLTSVQSNSQNGTVTLGTISPPPVLPATSNVYHFESNAVDAEHKIDPDAISSVTFYASCYVKRSDQPGARSAAGIQLFGQSKRLGVSVDFDTGEITQGYTAGATNISFGGGYVGDGWYFLWGKADATSGTWQGVNYLISNEESIPLGYVSGMFCASSTDIEDDPIYYPSESTSTKYPDAAIPGKSDGSGLDVNDYPIAGLPELLNSDTYNLNLLPEPDAPYQRSAIPGATFDGVGDYVAGANDLPGLDRFDFEFTFLNDLDSNFNSSGLTVFYAELFDIRISLKSRKILLFTLGQSSSLEYELHPTSVPVMWRTVRVVVEGTTREIWLDGAIVATDTDQVAAKSFNQSYSLFQEAGSDGFFTNTVQSAKLEGVFEYDFRENNGLVIPDRSGNGNDGTLVVNSSLSQIFAPTPFETAYTFGDGRTRPHYVTTTLEEDTYDFYVDSVNGNDSNIGSLSAPFATISKLMEQTLTDKRVALVRGSHWREEMDLTGAGFSNVTVHGFGPVIEPLPKIDGTDIASNAGWTATTATTNVFDRAWSNSIGSRAKAKISVFEDGDMLEWVADVATCDSTPGSFHIQDSSDYSDPETVYIHPTDSTDPTADGKLYEITARRDCFKGNGSFRDIHTTRQGNHDGSFIYSGEAENILASYGVVHNIWVSPGSTATNCVAYQAQPNWRSGTGATLFITYGSGGQTTRHYGCYAYHDLSDEHSSFYSHMASGTSELMLYDGCRLYSEGGVGINAADCDLVTVNDLFARLGATRSTSANTLFCSGGSLDINNATVMNPARILSRNVVDLRTHTTRSVSGAVLYSGPTTMTNSTLSWDPAISSVYRNVFNGARSASNTYQNIAVYGAQGNALRAVASDNAPVSDFNVFSWHAKFKVAGIEYNTLAEYQAITSTDANSIEQDPLIVDAANNDFTFQAGSPVDTSGRMAGSRKHIDEPDWAALKGAWEAGYLGIDSVTMAYKTQEKEFRTEVI
jgi:hypothetical protein